MKKSLFPVLLFIIVLLIVSIAYLSYTLFAKDTDNDTNQATSNVTETTKQEPETMKTYTKNSELSNIAISDEELGEKATVTTEYLPALIGESEGNSTVLAGSFVFPTSTLNIMESKQFEFNAEGFNLELLNNKELEIEENVYPEMGVIMSGVVSEKNGELNLIIDSLTPEFYITDKKSPLNGDTSLKILSNLENVGLVFPTVTKSNPLVVPITANFETNDTFVLNSQNADDLLFRYESKAK